MNPTRCLALALLALSPLLHGELTEEYSENSTNESLTPTLKKWIWKRDGDIILKREMENAHTSQTIYYKQREIYSISTSRNGGTVEVYPASMLELRIDSPDDASEKSIILLDMEKALIDCFTIQPDGIIVPVADDDLKIKREMLKKAFSALQKQ